MHRHSDFCLYLRRATGTFTTHLSRHVQRSAESRGNAHLPKDIPVFARCGHYIAIILLTFIFYLPYLLPGMGLLAGGDFFAFFAPYRIFTSAELNAGNFPLRTNQLFGGYPIFQDPQFALLYPVNLLFGLLVPDANSQSALDAYMLINSLLLSLAAVFFSRSFGFGRLASVVAAAVISFNGFIVIHYTHVNMLQVYTTSLVAAGLLVRYARGGANNFRLAVAAGVMLGMGNLAGHPQSTMYMHYAIAVGVAVLALRHWQQNRDGRAAARIAAAGIAAFVIGILLAAIQLLPTAELLRLSTRANVSLAEVLWSALGVPQLPVFFFPAFYEKVPWLHIIAAQGPAPAGIHEIVYYWIDPYEGMVTIGLFAATLGFTGWFCYWRRWTIQVLGWGSLFLVGCAVGTDLPFYGWLYDFIPGFKLVRVSTRILMLFFPAWGLLVGLGVQALWQRDACARNAGRGAASIIACLLIFWVSWIIEGSTSNWFQIWTGAVYAGSSDEVSAFIRGAREAGHFPYLELQLYLAIALFLLLLLVFWLPLRPRVRLAIALVFSAAELAIYGIGYVRPSHFPEITTVKAESLQSIPNQVSGRALAPGFLEGGGVVNSALYMDMPLANGYSVTVDDWITAFLPDVMPPWRFGVQRVLLDLWDVTDVVINSRPVSVTVDGRPLTIDDWGWSEIGSPAPQHTTGTPKAEVTPRTMMPSRITMDFVTTAPVQALHVIGFAGTAAALPDGVELGQVSVIPEPATAATTTSAINAASTTAPIILGTHLSDGRYYDVGHGAAQPVHSLAKQIHQRFLPNHPSHGMRLFAAKLDITTSAPISAITIEATAPPPASLAISHVVAILADGSAVVHEPVAMEGFTESKSRTAQFRTLQRDSSPGFIRVVPTAVAGSYKKTENVMWRLFNGQQDPLDSVIVDKRQFDDDELAQLNAPNPSELQATATIRWAPSHRTATITATSNQPAWLTLSYTWDAGWSATANGKPIKIYRANGPFMTIPISAGSTTIQMSYLPKGFMLGAIISALTALGIAILFIRLSKRHAETGTTT